MEHLKGDYPQLTFSQSSPAQRLPIALEDQNQLLHTLDFWFTYALYAGVSPHIIVVAVAGLALCAALAGIFLVRSLKTTTTGEGNKGHRP